jgi:hydroxymethylpyrimidine/phosphomethylpyrimidine kinase
MTTESAPLETPQDPAQDLTGPPCVMTFNANDPSGAGGTGGDVATLCAMGAHPLPVVTAVLIRDTAEVFDHHTIDDDAIVEQARSILEDAAISAWKVGFLGSAEGVSAVAEVLSDYPDVPLVTHLPNLSWMDEAGRSASHSGSRKSVSVLWLPTSTSVCGRISSRKASW